MLSNRYQETLVKAEKPYGARDFELHAIIPTRPCPIHPKQIRMGEMAHIIWILFIIRLSSCPGQDVAIVLPRDGEQRPTDRVIIACCLPFVYCHMEKNPSGVIYPT